MSHFPPHTAIYYSKSKSRAAPPREIVIVVARRTGCEEKVLPSPLLKRMLRQFIFLNETRYRARKKVVLYYIQRKTRNIHLPCKKKKTRCHLNYRTCLLLGRFSWDSFLDSNLYKNGFFLSGKLQRAGLCCKSIVNGFFFSKCSIILPFFFHFLSPLMKLSDTALPWPRNLKGFESIF